VVIKTEIPSTDAAADDNALIVETELAENNAEPEVQGQNEEAENEEETAADEGEEDAEQEVDEDNGETEENEEDNGETEENEEEEDNANNSADNENVTNDNNKNETETETKTDHLVIVMYGDNGKTQQLLLTSGTLYNDERFPPGSAQEYKVCCAKRSYVHSLYNYAFYFLKTFGWSTWMGDH